MPEGWRIGRKDICDFLKVGYWKAVLVLKKEGLPIRHLPNGKPVLIEIEAQEWLIAYDNLAKIHKKPRVFPQKPKSFTENTPK